MAEMQNAEVVYNCFGKHVTLADLRLTSEEFGQYRPDGSIEVYWADEDENVDGNGFDKHYEGTDGYFDVFEFEEGDMVCRYGGPGGQLTAPVGSNYHLLGLPYIQKTREYHEYRFKVNYTVKRGLVAPMFDSPGGATQYFPLDETVTIGALLDAGIIEEDFTWLEKVWGRDLSY